MDSATAPANTVTAPRRSPPEDADALRRRIMGKLLHNVGKPPGAASERDWFVATALAVRDSVIGTWLESTAAGHGSRRQARALPVARIPHRPAAFRCHGQSRPRRRGAGGAGGGRRGRGAHAGARARPGARQWRARAARGLLHGEHGDARHPRLRLRHPLRARAVPPGLRGRRPDRAAGRLARPRQPLGIRAAGGGVSRRLRRRGEGAAGRGRERPRRLGARRVRVGRRLRHARHRRRRPARHHLAPVVRPRRLAAPPGGLQPRRPCRRAPRPRAPGSDLARALPRRRIARGAGAAAAAAILLRHRLPAGPAAPPPRRVRRPPLAPGQGGDPAQRHPPRPRRRRADAPVGGLARDGVGRGVADRRRHRVLHQPHPDAGSAGDLAGGAVRAPAAPPHRDHIPAERRAPGARARGHRRRGRRRAGRRLA